MLRRKLEKVIGDKLDHKISFGEKEDLALDILTLLESEMDIIGNGWLDDEPDEIIDKINERL